jgi:hypothetical protein
MIRGTYCRARASGNPWREVYYTRRGCLLPSCLFAATGCASLSLGDGEDEGEHKREQDEGDHAVTYYG